MYASSLNLGRTPIVSPIYRFEIRCEYRKGLKGMDSVQVYLVSPRTISHVFMALLDAFSRNGLLD